MISPRKGDVAWPLVLGLVIVAIVLIFIIPILFKYITGPAKDTTSMTDIAFNYMTKCPDNPKVSSYVTDAQRYANKDDFERAISVFKEYKECIRVNKIGGQEVVDANPKMDTAGKSSFLYKAEDICNRRCMADKEVRDGFDKEYALNSKEYYSYFPQGSDVKSNCQAVKPC